MNRMRLLHRYLGYFLTGMMAVYAITGIIMTFRDTDFLKSEKHESQTVKPHLAGDELGKALDMRRLKVTKEDSLTIYFENGTYAKETGVANYTLKEWPPLVVKMTELHQSRSADPLFFLNVFFACSLFFFVVSSFWMFPSHSQTFRKGMLFVAAGVILVVVLIWLK